MLASAASVLTLRPLEDSGLTTILFVLAILLAVVNSFRLPWIVYLSKREKVFTLAYSLLLFLGFNTIFVSTEDWLNPRILVLDDALSSVDTYTEERILNHLREVMVGRTTIFISHRVSTVRNADRIFVVESGGIAEEGPHAELLALGGYYADLYQKQLLEEELEAI